MDLSELFIALFFSIAIVSAALLGYAIGANKIAGVPFFILSGCIGAYYLGKYTRRP